MLFCPVVPLRAKLEAEADTQFTIFALFALKKQCLIFLSTLTNAEIDAKDHLVFTTGAAAGSGTVDLVTVTVHYYRASS